MIFNWPQQRFGLSSGWCACA